jgi:hypothetical protein
MMRYENVGAEAVLRRQKKGPYTFKKSISEASIAK